MQVAGKLDNLDAGTPCGTIGVAMKYLRITLVLTAVILVGSAYAASLDDFYTTIYSENASDSLATVFDSFLSGSDSADDIDNAIQMWNSYDYDACITHISTLYRKQPSNRNVGIAWVLADPDFAKAMRTARKVIMLNREDPMAYQPMVMRYLYEFPSASNPEEWDAYHGKILQDSAYFFRYQELAPDNEYAILGKTIAAMARFDMLTARKMIDLTVTESISLSKRIDITYLTPDPSYFDLMLYYLSKSPEDFDAGDSDTIYAIAEAVVSRYYDQSAWQEIVDLFGARKQYQSFGVVALNLLVAYQELGLNDQALELISAEGIDSALNLIYWWQYYYPEHGCIDFVNGLHASFPDNEIATAVWLIILDEPETKLIASRTYIEDFPDKEVGYNMLFDAWRLYYQDHDFLDPAEDETSGLFVDDLIYWDAYARIDSVGAMKAIVAVLENSYNSEHAQNVIRMKDLRPEWIANSEIQFILINAYFNTDDYDSVMKMLFSMTDNGLVSLSDLEGLQSSENPIIMHKDWESLIQHARNLNQNQSPDSDQVDQ